MTEESFFLFTLIRSHDQEDLDSVYIQPLSFTIFIFKILEFQRGEIREEPDLSYRNFFFK